MIIRHDDFDFRMNPEEYIENHEKFIKADVVETAVIQIAKDGKLNRVDPLLVNYMNTVTHWDLQLHGWEHAEYDKMTYDEIIKDLGASIAWMRRMFNKGPTVWYPPWNKRTDVMEKAAEFFGLEIDNESCDISRFIREKEAGIFKGNSVYFHLWSKSEAEQIDRMIELCK